MNYLKQRAEKVADNNGSVHPHWVSVKNASFAAWKYVELAREEKALYIRRHRKVTDYLTQKVYQIKGAEVAKAVNVSRPSLMNTSSYSEHFRRYLDGINAELEKMKNERLKCASQALSRGSISSSKDELVNANKLLTNRVSELESQKTEEIVRRAFDQLPLPVKAKLGID